MLSIETMLTTETFYVTMLTLPSYRATERGAMARKCALEGTLSCTSHSITFDRYVLCSRQGVTAMLDFQKIALITGANKGIGFEIARQLGAKGIIVLIGVRDQARGDEAARRLQSEGIEASAVHLDVTEQPTIEQTPRFIAEPSGKLDILSNNAGISLTEGKVPPNHLHFQTSP